MRLIKRFPIPKNLLGHTRKSINWDAVTAIATVASAFVSLGVLCIAVFALLYTKNQIEDFRKESQTQHLVEKVQKFDGLQFRVIRRSLAEKRLNQAKDGLKKLDVDDAPVEMFDALDFCNDLGILLRHGEVSAYDVWGDFSFWLLPFYADAEGLVKADQKDAPAAWSNCVYLIEQVRSVDEHEDAGKQLTQTQDEIIDFYASEIEENPLRGIDSTKH
jgi:hypothetical protein